eukprot:1142849-Pelagomonas_calceolata.AAC.7
MHGCETQQHVLPSQGCGRVHRPVHPEHVASDIACTKYEQEQRAAAVAAGDEAAAAQAAAASQELKPYWSQIMVEEGLLQGELLQVCFILGAMSGGLEAVGVLVEKWLPLKSVPPARVN